MGLQEKLKSAANADTVVAIAQKPVLSSSADDIKTGQEISDEALDGVAGGPENNDYGQKQDHQAPRQNTAGH